MADPFAFSNAKGIGQRRSDAIRRPTMLTRDPPEHTRLRRLVQQAFTPRRVAELRQRVTRIVDDLLDRALDPPGSRGGTRECDLVGALSRALPVTVIAEILSVAPERRADFERWSEHIIASVAQIGQPPDRALLEQSYREFDAYFLDLVAARRARPRDDLIGALVAALDDDAERPESRRGPLTSREIVDV